MSRSTEFLAGCRDEAPLLLGVAPFGMIYAIAALAAGVPAWVAQLASALVFAGAAIVVPLVADNYAVEKNLATTARVVRKMLRCTQRQLDASRVSNVLHCSERIRRFGRTTLTPRSGWLTEPSEYTAHMNRLRGK